MPLPNELYGGVCVMCVAAVNVVDPHAPGGAKHFDRTSMKRKYDEMAGVRGRDDGALLPLPFHSLTPSLSPLLPSLTHSLHLSSLFFLPLLTHSISLQEADSGNFTLETAKSRLHLYLQQTRQPRDMQIRPAGPDHNRSFVAEMTIYVPKMHQSKRNVWRA